VGGGRVSLGGGGHDHGAGHDRRHGMSEARQHRTCTSDDMSEAWHGGVMLVPTAARVRRWRCGGASEVQRG
jgi:hypothetical protein